MVRRSTPLGSVFFLIPCICLDQRSPSMGRHRLVHWVGVSDHTRVSHAHVRPLHPAALAFVPYGIVLVRVRVFALGEGSAAFINQTAISHLPTHAARQHKRLIAVDEARSRWLWTFLVSRPWCLCRHRRANSLPCPGRPREARDADADTAEPTSSKSRQVEVTARPARPPSSLQLRRTRWLPTREPLPHAPRP